MHTGALTRVQHLQVSLIPVGCYALTSYAFDALLRYAAITGIMALSKHG